MRKQAEKTVSEIEIAERIEGVRIGKVVLTDGKGRILVDFPGNPGGPVSARVTASERPGITQGMAMAGREVLMVFENNDPGLPIIIDTMDSLLDEIADPPPAGLDAKRPEDVLVDGKRLILDARDEVVIRCGKSSITLTKAGKVLIRGEYVLSRSSGANKIKGASIELN